MTATNHGSKISIKYQPTKDFLENYFDMIKHNARMYMVFLKTGTKSQMCYELDGEIYTYRMFMDKTECEFYAAYVAKKNNIPSSYINTSSLTADEIVEFMVTIQQNNPDKVMRMMACAFWGDNVAEIDTFWSNAVKYTC